MRPDLSTLLAPTGSTAVAPADLMETVDLRRTEVAGRIAKDLAPQAEVGQFLTPAPVARFTAGMLSRQR